MGWCIAGGGLMLVGLLCGMIPICIIGAAIMIIVSCKLQATDKQAASCKLKEYPIYRY